MRPSLNNPLASTSFFFLGKVDIFQDDFDLCSVSCLHHPLDIFDKQRLLAVFKRRDVHHHVDFLGAHIHHRFRLKLLHRRCFIAMGKANHSSQQYTTALKLLETQSNVMGLNGKRGGF